MLSDEQLSALREQFYKLSLELLAPYKKEFVVDGNNMQALPHFVSIVILPPDEFNGNEQMTLVTSMPLPICLNILQNFMLQMASQNVQIAQQEIKTQ